MFKFLLNYDDDELLYFTEELDSILLKLDSKSQLLRDIKDEILTFLSNKKEEN